MAIKKDQISRRKLLQSTVSALGVACFPALLCRKAGASQPPRRTSSHKSRCAPTEPNVEGPFHCTNAPWRTQIAGPREKGVRLHIEGIVTQPDCKTPIANATLEIWHADHSGQYDNTCQEPSSPTTYRLRAQITTNAKGEYAYNTIIPGRYLDGGTYRPAHIHYKVHAHGYQSLTTQLYFSGDPYIKGDPFVRPSLVITLSQKGKQQYGRFDIVLRSNPKPGK